MCFTADQDGLDVHWKGKDLEMLGGCWGRPFNLGKWDETVSLGPNIRTICNREMESCLVFQKEKK